MAFAVPLPGPLFGPSMVRSLMAAISLSLISADSAAVPFGWSLTTLSVKEATAAVGGSCMFISLSNSCIIGWFGATAISVISVASLFTNLVKISILSNVFPG